MALDYSYWLVIFLQSERKDWKQNKFLIFSWTVVKQKFHDR